MKKDSTLYKKIKRKKGLMASEIKNPVTLRELNERIAKENKWFRLLFLS